jgi:hypothetical protein
VLNRQKFLEKLGISPNWNVESHPDCQNRVCTDEGITGNWTLLYFSGRNLNVPKDRVLVSCAPDMLCDMVESAMQFLFYADQHDKKGNGEKMEVNLRFAKQSIKTIERATGKSWDEVLEIAKECKE